MTTTEAKRVYLQNENNEILLPYSAQALEDGDGNVISETYVKKTDGGFVAKTGDTMSGDLMIARADGTPYLKAKRTNATLGDTPSDRINIGGLSTHDSANNTLALVQGYILADGTNGLQLVTRKPDNSGWGAGIDLSTDADGNRYLKFNGIDIGYAMPKIGKKSEALTAVNEQIYTAPADGCYTIVATGGNQAYVRFYNQTSGGLGHLSRTSDGGGTCATSMYCSKGDKVQLQMTATKANSFKFIYGKNDGV